MAERGHFAWVLSGGRTPVELYRLLGTRYRRTFPWAFTEVFFADERCVGPRHPDSNFGSVWATLLSRVPIARPRIHRLRGELHPPSEAARQYARLLGPIPPASSRAPPRFDLVLLGIGADGHTASLFPGDPAVDDRRHTVRAVRRAGQPPFVPRLTLTLPALSSGREVWFLVAGSDKAEVVRGVLRSGPKGTDRYPASRVRPPGPTRWFLDREAAAGLSPVDLGRGPA